MEFIVNVCFFDSDSKFFLFLLLYLRTAFYFLFYYVSFSFQNYFLIYFFFFTYVFIPRTSNPQHLPPFVRGALYLSVPRYQYLYTLLGVRPNFKARTMAFIYFLFFIFFLSGFFYCWSERNTGRHFIGFYKKNKG